MVGEYTKTKEDAEEGGQNKMVGFLKKAKKGFVKAAKFQFEGDKSRVAARRVEKKQEAAFERRARMAEKRAFQKERLKARVEQAKKRGADTRGFFERLEERRPIIQIKDPARPRKSATSKKRRKKRTTKKAAQPQFVQTIGGGFVQVAPTPARRTVRRRRRTRRR